MDVCLGKWPWVSPSSSAASFKLKNCFLGTRCLSFYSSLLLFLSLSTVFYFIFNFLPFSLPIAIHLCISSFNPISLTLPQNLSSFLISCLHYQSFRSVLPQWSRKFRRCLHLDHTHICKIKFEFPLIALQYNVLSVRWY